MLLELIICFIAFGLVLSYVWMPKTRSVGLPLCYIMSLGMIHWLGALIHVFSTSWHSQADLFTEVGFQQAFWGTMSFAVGTFVIAPLLLQHFLHVHGKPTVMEVNAEQLRLPQIYLLIGVASFGFLAPALASVPSFRAVSVCGIYLAVVGVCLACWSAYIRHEFLKLLGWLGLVCLIPLVTIITLGFVGYGASAALMVFTFVMTYYRPRWQAVIGLSALVFLGLSVFVTYFRDRPIIRAKVWGNAAYSERLDSVATTFSNFEFVDLSNARHLNAIDARLNQNYLVGRVVRTIELGQERFSYGGTFYEAFLALIPRIFWPDKPVAAGSGNTVSRYARLTFAEGTSVGIGHVMEFYINLGTSGVIIGFIIIGVIIRIVDTMAALHLHTGNWEGFMSWFVPSISLLNVGGSLVETFGTAASSLVLVALVNRVLNSWRFTDEISPRSIHQISRAAH